MICQNIATLLGLACHPLVEDGSIALIETPFRFADGDSVPVYVEHLGNGVRFFDDGGIYMHFKGRGLPMKNANQLKFLKQATESNGTVFSDEGVIEVFAPEAKASTAFASYIKSVTALIQWEKEHINLDHDTEIFVEEVAQCLRAWKRVSQLERAPRLVGITGRAYTLDFELDDQVVVAVTAHHQSVSAALHKLVDIRALPGNRSLNVLIVIDDRTDPEAARRESKILSSVGDVMNMGQLQMHAGASASMH